MSELGKFVPLPDAQSERVNIQLPFPAYINQRAIGVNIRRVEKLCDLGGIKHLTIKGKSGDTSKVNMGISGYDASGSAYGSKTLTEEVPIFEINIIDQQTTDKPHSIPHARKWINGDISVNMSEIADQITLNNDKKNTLRSSNAWATHVNEAIQDGLSEIGVHHLTLGITRANLALSATGNLYSLISEIMYPSFPTGYSTEFNPQVPTLGGLLENFVMVNTILNIWEYATSRNKNDPYRLSLFYGPQFDRAALLKMSSKISKLVKDIPTTE